jgi:hypothetical protein
MAKMRGKTKAAGFLSETGGFHLAVRMNPA